MTPSNPPLKVLFLTACTGKGGAGRSLYLICKHLDRERFDPLVVMPNAGVIGEKLEALGIPVILAPRLRERFHELRFSRSGRGRMALSYLMNALDSLLFVWQLAGIVRRQKVDLIHCNHMMVKIMGIVAGALTGRPVVLHTRTIYGSPLERYLYLSFARLPHVRRIIAVSRAAAANFHELSDRVRVIHNGVPLDNMATAEPGSLRRELGFGDDLRLVGFVGRLVEWKGIGVFLDAAQELARRREDVGFVVVGDLPVGSTHATLDGYRAEAARRGLENRLAFTGFRDDAAAVMEELDVLAVPSIRPDPCPRVVLEGLGKGTPVVGADCGGIAETIREGETGLLATPGDAADLVRQIERVLDDPELAARIGESGRRSAREEFSAAVVSRRVQEVLWEAAGGEGGGDGRRKRH